MDPRTADLWARCRSGDVAARAELIESYRPLASLVARRFGLNSDALDSLEDREAAGTIGLIQAVDRFEPERGVPFEAFARVRIRGAIIDEMRRLAGRRTTPLDTAEDDASAQRTLSLEQLAERGHRADVAISNGIDERIASDGLRHDVSAALNTMPLRDRSVLAAYYTEGLTLAAIGARIGVSEARVCQIHGKAIRQLRSLLGVSAPATYVSAA